jgi:hypothetical protein
MLVDFLIIEIESGVPLYNAIYNIEKNYKVIGAYFGDIVNKVYLVLVWKMLLMKL